MTTISDKEPNLDYIVDYLPLQLEFLYAEAVELFNLKPTKAISFLVDRKVIENIPCDVAQFFFIQTKLSKRLMGEYLGSQETFNQNVAECLFALFPFSGLSLDEGIRALARRIRLPGEAQKIDRILEKFAASYHDQNLKKLNGLSFDALYILSFSIIMLNTDLHNPSIARNKKMTLNEFIRNNKGINVGVDIPSAMLKDLYQKIKKCAITMNEEDMFESTEFDFIGPIKAGWLEKDVHGYIGRTVKRWFVLKNSCLYYFSAPNEKIPRCIIPLDGVSVSKISSRHILITGRNGESKIKARKNIFKQKSMFSVTSKAETLSTRTSLRLGAPSEAECFDWYIHLKGETEPINGILNHTEGKESSPLLRADGKGIVDESLQQDIKLMVKARNSINLTNSEIAQLANDIRSNKSTDQPTSMMVMSPAKIRIPSFSISASREVKASSFIAQKPSESATVESGQAADTSTDEIPPPVEGSGTMSLIRDPLLVGNPSPPLVLQPLPPREEPTSGSSRGFGVIKMLISGSRGREVKSTSSPSDQDTQTPGSLQINESEKQSTPYFKSYKSYKSNESTPVVGVTKSSSMFEIGNRPLESDLTTLRRKSISASMTITPQREMDIASSKSSDIPSVSDTRDLRTSEPSSPVNDENALHVDRVSMYLEGRAMLLHRNLARNVNLRRPSDPLQLVLSAPIKEGWLLVRDCTDKFRYNSADGWVMKYCLLCDSIDKFGPTLFYFPCREVAMYMQRYADQTQQRYVRLKFADFLSVNSVGLPADGSNAGDGTRPLRISPLRISPHRQRDSSQEKKRNAENERKSEAKSDNENDIKSEAKESTNRDAKSESKSTSSSLVPADKRTGNDSRASSPTPGNLPSSNQSTPRRTGTSAASSSKKQGIIAALQRITSLTTNVSKLAKQVEEDDDVEEKDAVLLTPVRTVLREADGRDSPDSPNFEIREQIWRKMDSSAGNRISHGLTSPILTARSGLSIPATGAASGSKSLWRKFESGIPLECSPPVRGMSCSCATCATVTPFSLGECQVRTRCKDASLQLFDVYLSHPDTRELWRWFDKFKDIALDESI